MDENEQFLNWVNAHLVEAESYDSDCGEITSFQGVEIGGFNFDEDQHFVNDNPKAKKLYSMWEIYVQ
ncbi:hypothetical protein ACP3V3_03005 [Vibrio sp. PNB22_3_1]